MTQTVFRIPLKNTPQRFEIELAGRSFIMVVRWNPAMPNWILCLLDGETEQPLLNCLPFTTGVDLLSQFRHVGIEGSFVVVTDGDEFATPTLENLGGESNLYYVVDR
jgi:hypothetical protein